jgi:ABC-type uncharacterized transport system permease subunit
MNLTSSLTPESLTILLGLFLFSSLGFIASFATAKKREWSSLLLRCSKVLFLLGTAKLTFLVAKHESGTSVLLAAVFAWINVIAWQIWPLDVLGAFSSPLISLLLLVWSYFDLRTGIVQPKQETYALLVHVGSAVIGQAFATIATGLALLFLWQERLLKTRQINSFPISFPAMDTLTTNLNRSLWIGFIFITMTLLTGVLVLTGAHETYAISVEAKVLWAILVWVWYLTLLVLKEILHYRMQRVARLSVIGFLLMALCWFGMAFTWQWS